MPRHSTATTNMTVRMAALSTVNEEDGSVEAVVATDRAVMVYDMQNFRLIDEILVADGGEFPSDVPLLDAHQRYSCGDVLGGATDFKRVGSEWRGRAVFDVEDDDAAKVYRKVVRGFIKSVSIGYKVTRATEIRPGERATINGREYRANSNRVLRVAQRWQVFELSVTPIGADERAKFRDGVSVLTTREVGNMNPRLMAYLRRLGLAQDASEDQARQFHAELRGSQRAVANALDYDEADQSARTSADLMIRSLGFDPEQPVNVLHDNPSQGGTDSSRSQSTPAGGDGARHDAVEIDPAVVQDAIKAERERVAQIRSHAGPDVPENIVEQAIVEGWTVERAYGRFLEEIKARRGDGVSITDGAGPAIHSRSKEKDKTALALTSALMERSGMNVFDNYVENRHGMLVKGTLSQDEREKAADFGYRYRGMSLIEMMREACRIDGLNVDGYERNELFQRAMSSGTLTNIFTTNFSAQLLSGYENYADTTAPFTVTNGGVPNFQTNERPRMKKGDKLTKLARGKEADHVTRDDIAESYKIARYAAQFRLDEQDMIDDRFGGLENTPVELGEAAAELRPDLVYSILLGNPAMSDTTALFHADHNNLATSTALTAANLELQVANFNKQTENGRLLNKTGPIVLITPEALWATAERLVMSPQRVDDNTQGNLNPLRSQRFQRVSEARLDNGVTDPASGTAHSGSATTWFLARSGRHTIEVGYLASSGQRPMVRSWVETTGRWGMGWAVKMDIGAKALDWLGLRKHTA